jgi:DNA-binding transcriptional LysR family regulator
MSPRHLDLNLLRAFDALMLERSVTRAAARLALTQPAVSGMLNRLREAFEDPLFVRTQRGIAPTLKALSLADPIHRILADTRQLLQPDAFVPATASFTATIAATDYAARAIVQPFLVALRGVAPGIRVAVCPLDESAVLERMERGDLDWALLTPETTPPGLHARPLFEERYVCVMRASHPMASPAEMSLEVFCTLDHGIVSPQGGGFSGATDAALARLGRQRRVVVSVPSFVMLLELVRSTDIVALLPERLIDDPRGLQVQAPPLDVPGFTKLLTWHARTHHDAGYRWLRQQLVQSCAPALNATDERWPPSLPTSLDDH